MLELGKDFAEIIKEGKWVVDAWKSNCGYCDQYAPTFEQVATESTNGVKFAKVKADDVREFRNAYLMGEEITLPNGIKQRKSLGSPTTFIFNNGVKTAVAEGNMPKEALKSFIETGVAPVRTPQPNQRLGQLYAMKGELITGIELRQNDLQKVNAEIMGLLQPNKE